MRMCVCLPAYVEFARTVLNAISSLIEHGQEYIINSKSHLFGYIRFPRARNNVLQTTRSMWIFEVHLLYSTLNSNFLAGSCYFLTFL